MKIIPRSGWKALPAKSVTPADPHRWKGVVVHWFGKPSAAHYHRDCPKLLRAVQRAHMMNTKEGYVDIAYNFAVCPHGHLYELRGLHRRCGANGTTEANIHFMAIVVMNGEDKNGVPDKFTIEERQTLRDAIHWARGQGVGKIVKPHGAITGSECPGASIRKWVENKRYEIHPA
jgi:hypothetical protein